MKGNNMQKHEMLLAAKMLHLAADEFSNNSCNDVSAGVRKLLTKDQWATLDKEYHEWNGDPKEHSPEHPDIKNYDYILMRFLAVKLEKEAGA